MMIRMDRMRNRIKKTWLMRFRIQDKKYHWIYFKPSFQSQQENKYFQICSLTLEILYVQEVVTYFI